MVRRMDELGRIVIPKEIRRTLRIRDGDPLEIFVDRGNEVILKRYAPITAVEDYAQEYVDALYESLGKPAIITDAHEVVAIAGLPKKNLLGRALSEEFLERVAAAEAPILSRTAGELPVVEGQEYQSQVIVPIRARGEFAGAVIILSRDPKLPVGEVESKLAQTAADFLAKRLR